MNIFQMRQEYIDKKINFNPLWFKIKMISADGVEYAFTSGTDAMAVKARIQALMPEVVVKVKPVFYEEIVKEMVK